jgi:uncharacterized BrkB/YihY/UPF0761 family membrane protein
MKKIISHILIIKYKHNVRIKTVTNETIILSHLGYLVSFLFNFLGFILFYRVTSYCRNIQGPTFLWSWCVL